MIECARRARSSSPVRSVPPSPAVSVFEDWWLNEPNAPMHPAPRPPHCWPCACAQSSTIASPCRSAIAASRSMSAICWPRCTGMMARVRGVIAASTASGSIVQRSGSTSTITGSAPGRDRGVGGGGERQRRHDHLVAPADPERLQRHLHGDRPVHHHDSVGRALVGGEPRRELGVARARLRPAPDLPVQHHIRHGVGVALVDLRPGRIRLAAHAGTAVNRQNAHPNLRDVLTPVRSRAYFPHCQ